jgi:glutaredoxin
MTVMASSEGTIPAGNHFDKITVFGADWCGDCRRAKKVLGQAGTDYDWIDLEKSEEDTALAEALSGQRHIPVIVFPDDTFIVEPTNPELAARL